MYVCMYVCVYVCMYVATKESKSRVGLGCDVVNMLVPAQVVRYLDTKVLGNVYMFQLMTVQCVWQ